MDTPVDGGGSGFRGRGRGMPRGRGFTRGSFGRGGGGSGGSGSAGGGGPASFNPVYPSGANSVAGVGSSGGGPGAFPSPGRRPVNNPASMGGHASLTSITGIDMGMTANMPFAPPVQSSSSSGHRSSSANVFETTPSRWELEQRAKVTVSHAHIASPGTYYPRVSRHNNPIIPGLPRPKEVVNVVNLGDA
ncbi:hypothetical protein BDF19DRAFT_10777 [Syncephalis fuscata]|nr:hypothetical protein BDF19DRAFT_10777 [Syncephalis fuscata]